MISGIILATYTKIAATSDNGNLIVIMSKMIQVHTARLVTPCVELVPQVNHYETIYKSESKKLLLFLNMLCDKTELNLTLLHSEWPKLHRVLAVLSAIGLNWKLYYLFLLLHVSYTLGSVNNVLKIIFIYLQSMQSS